MEIFEVGGHRYLKVSWGRLEELVEMLAEKVSKGDRPDFLIGILRGGMTVAHLLSDILEYDEIYPIGCSSYVDVREKRELRVYSPLVLRDLSGKRVLVVDDVADSGGTLREIVRREVMPKNPLEVKTATLHIKPWSTFKPDYYVEVTDAWIVYPWEKHEIMRQLGPTFIEHLGVERGVEELAELVGKEAKKVRKVVLTARE